METEFGYSKLKVFCPHCGRKSFNLQTLDGEVISDTVGYCDHSNSCSYSYFAKEYFKQNPNLHKIEYHLKKVFEPKVPSFMEESLIQKYRSNESGIIKYLLTIFPTKAVYKVAEQYKLGSYNNGNVIFWQIDEQGRCRTGKIVSYGSDGHRNGYMNWMHTTLKLTDFNLVQSLFGAHLLALEPEKTVCLVESAKSAIIGAIVNPNYLWLSTEGATNWRMEKLLPLRHRKVIVYPDLWKNPPKGKCDWHKLVDLLMSIGAKASYCDILEQISTQEQRDGGYDLADFILNEFKKNENSDEGDM